MKNKYKSDLQLFYSLFTGKKNIPDNITKFGQIPLRDFKDVEMCKNNGLFRQSYKGNLNEKLQKHGFRSYVELANTAEGQVYRVRIGPFLIKEQAEDIQVSVKTQFSLNAKLMSQVH